MNIGGDFQMTEIKLSTVLDLIKNKNEIGFELLYKHHYKLLFSTAFTITQNEEDSRDVVQNVVYKLAKMPEDKFPEKGQVSWLYRVARNEAINFMKNRKQYDYLDESNIEIPVIDKDLDEIFDMDNYYSLIENLNENQKKVVTLKVLGELSHKEIAMMLDKPIGTIQWIYSTSIKQLRVSLSAMASFIVVLAIGAGVRGYKLYKDIFYFDPEIVGHPGVSDNPIVSDFPLQNKGNLFIELINDDVFMIFIIALLMLIVATIIFLKYSDKISIKQKNSIV